MERGSGLPHDWGPGALHAALVEKGELAGAARARELGALAARTGYARRFLLDVARGLLNIPPHSAIPALRELANADPASVTALLYSSDTTAAAVAAMALGCNDPPFEHILLTAARGPEPALRAAAVAGMGEAAAAASRTAVEALGGLLSDADTKVRWSAAVHLGAARGRACVGRAIALLAAAAASGDENAASGAAFGLARIWPARKKEAADLLVRIAQLGGAAQRAAALAIRHLPRTAARRAATLCYASEDPDVRAACVGALAAWARGVEAGRRDLVRLARDPNPVVRATAAEAIAAAEHTDPALVETLATDSSPLVRAGVAQGLGACVASQHAELLRSLARDEAAPVRMAALRALGGKEMGDLIRSGCRDPAPRVRAVAVAVLCPHGDDDVELLLHLTRDRDGSVVRAAARALGRCTTGASGLAWDRLVELSAGGTAADAAAEGLAAALDRDPGSAASILWGWPVTPTSARLFGRIARVSERWEVAEPARTLWRALTEEGDLSEALADAAIAFSATGRADVARLLAWLADCARCATCHEIGAACSVSPGRRSQAVAAVALAGEAIGNAARARASETEHHVARAQAALEALLQREENSLEWAFGRRIARHWADVLDAAAGAADGGEMHVGLLSRCVICGSNAALVIEVENRGHLPITQLELAIHGAPAASGPDLAPGQRRELEVRSSVLEAGSCLVRGRLRYRRENRLHESGFAGAIRAVQAGPLGAIANPYIVGKPLAGNSSMFFGRAGEIEYVERALASGQGGSVVVLVGARRTGKTSLLKQLAARLSESCRPVFVDVQGMLVSDTEDFFRNLARMAVQQSEWGEMLTDGGLARSTGAEMVREAAARSDRRIVLLLDEFDDLDEKVRAGRMGADAYGHLRSLIQHGGNLGLVLCGTHRLEQLAGEHWSFLLNLATYRRIGCLTAEDGERVLREPLSRLGIICEDAAASRAMRLTGAHPYFLQLLGYRLVESCVAAGEAAVRADSVEQAADEVVEQGDIHLRYLWESAGEDGGRVLVALAAAEEAMEAEQLRQRLGFTGAALGEILQRMSALELVAGGENRYHVCTGLLSRWLRRRQPAGWRVSE